MRSLGVSLTLLGFSLLLQRVRAGFYIGDYKTVSPVESPREHLGENGLSEEISIYNMEPYIDYIENYEDNDGQVGKVPIRHPIPYTRHPVTPVISPFTPGGTVHVKLRLLIPVTVNTKRRRRSSRRKPPPQFQHTRRRRNSEDEDGWVTIKSSKPKRDNNPNRRHYWNHHVEDNRIQDYDLFTSFDDVPASSTHQRPLDEKDLHRRLSKMDYYFESLGVKSEDCRLRVLCEVVRDPDMYSPLTEMFQEETHIVGSLRNIGRDLLMSPDGTRLLSYMEASQRALDRSQRCDVYRRSCHLTANDVINKDALAVWREVVRWLTMKVLSQDQKTIRARKSV